MLPFLFNKNLDLNTNLKTSGLPWEIMFYIPTQRVYLLKSSAFLRSVFIRISDSRLKLTASISLQSSWTDLLLTEKTLDPSVSQEKELISWAGLLMQLDGELWNLVSLCFIRCFRDFVTDIVLNRHRIKDKPKQVFKAETKTKFR